MKTKKSGTEDEVEKGGETGTVLGSKVVDGIGVLRILCFIPDYAPKKEERDEKNFSSVVCGSVGFHHDFRLCMQP